MSKEAPTAKINTVNKALDSSTKIIISATGGGVSGVALDKVKFKVLLNLEDQ